VTADAVERKLAAILSADVVGYSRLMAEDEAATIRTLTEYREQVAMLVRQHRGRVVDSPGDNVLAEFPTALDAVQAVVEIQRVIQARNADLPTARRMEFRIGVHLGDVSAEGERLYGDGVNIASRLEGLSEAGGICISGTVHEQVRHKLNLTYEDLGEQTVKNIPDPIRVYRVRSVPEAAPTVERRFGASVLVAVGVLVVIGIAGWLLWRQVPDGLLAKDDFFSRPAIAVLPFDNLSGDPEQEYFADGIAEDLITRLSTWGGFPVIARNSSFVYKGEAVDIKQVSGELGARYVVEGSVRRAGDHVRISAQLIDATTGHHIWAKQYDRELQDIFVVQDEITEAVVASMYPTLQQFDWERAARREPENLDAWDTAERGSWHLNQLTKGDNTEARRLFERAIELDPQLASAFWGLAWTHYNDVVFLWANDADRSLAEMFRTAQRSVALDDTDPYGYLALTAAYHLTGQLDRARAVVKTALELNPSLAMAYYWSAALREGGLKDLEKAMRLSPQGPWMWLFLEGMAYEYFELGQYAEAVDWGERAVQRRPDYLYVHLLLASSYAHLDRLEEAHAALAQARTLQPGVTLAAVAAVHSTWSPGSGEPYIDGLRKAGLQ
jgi:adenylate cyclase